VTKALTLCLAAALALAPIGRPALAAYDPNNARRDCERAIKSGYGLDSFYNVRVDEKKSGKDYNVYGRVRIKNAKDRDFSCRIRDRSIKEAKVDNYNKNSNDSGGGISGKEIGAAAAVGALALGAAALLGGLGGSDSGTSAGSGGSSSGGGGSSPGAGGAGNGITWDQPSQGGGSGANSGGGIAWNQPGQTGSTGGGTTSANTQLRDECGRALRQKIQAEGGSLRDLSLTKVDVSQRDVRASGGLVWQSGRRGDVAVTCNWDRSGKLYVADYTVR